MKSWILALLLLTGFCNGEESFIIGNKFKSLCRYSFDEYGFHINSKLQNNCWFVKSDLLDRFFQERLPSDDFILISHNADHGVEDHHLPFLELPQLIHWYGQNVNTHHSKLSGIPIGLCNFANHKIVREVQQRRYPKKNLVYANYCVSTNLKERNECAEKTGVPNASRRPFRQYLTDIAKSYFVISPDGNGIDTHRTWEALYLRAIPIVTRSPTTEHFAHLPMIILESWDDYQDLDLSPHLYHEIWGDFDPESLTVEAFIPEHHR